MSAEGQFQPVSAFSWDINRAERSRQARWLAPLLDQPEGRAWFLERLACPCSPAEAQAAEVFHLCFPLRDVFTADYYQCRGNSHLEDQFIANYNHLVECKYKSELSMEQHKRHQMMGKTLARRLDKAFHFGLVVEVEPDPHLARIDEPYVCWSEIRARLGKA